MEVYAVDIRSWTASFRYPNLLSGVQPTLEVPPISTILGLLNAAAGFYIKHRSITLGYYFEYEGKAMDLETIYMVENKGKPSNNVKSNVINREVLFGNFLRLYLTDERLVNYLKNPVYQLVLGRMNDLATVDISQIEKKDLPATENADQIRGQIVPFLDNQLPGIIQALPQYFSDTIPRRNIGTLPYSIINFRTPVQSNLNCYRDMIKGKTVDVYMHSLTFEDD